MKTPDFRMEDLEELVKSAPQGSPHAKLLRWINRCCKAETALAAANARIAELEAVASRIVEEEMEACIARLRGTFTPSHIESIAAAIRARKDAP